MSHGLELHKDRKGQSSFEMAMITVAIVTLAFVVLVHIPKNILATGSVAVLKSEILKELSKQDELYLIDQIEEPSGVGSTGDINVWISGPSVSAIKSDIEAKDTMLEDLNFYSDVKINVNEAP